MLVGCKSLYFVYSTHYYTEAGRQSIFNTNESSALTSTNRVSSALTSTIMYCGSCGLHYKGILLFICSHPMSDDLFAGTTFVCTYVARLGIQMIGINSIYALNIFLQICRCFWKYWKRFNLFSIRRSFSFIAKKNHDIFSCTDKNPLYRFMFVQYSTQQPASSHMPPYIVSSRFTVGNRRFTVELRVRNISGILCKHRMPSTEIAHCVINFAQYRMNRFQSAAHG